jgi:hypothetical protein
MRAEATHITVAGRLNLGVQLTQEPPGIKGLYYVSGASRSACARLTHLCFPCFPPSALRRHLPASDALF